MHAYLYAIADQAGCIKIGRSANHPGRPRGRLADLQAGNSAQLVLVAACRDEPVEDIERHMHTCLARLGLHQRGKWFRPSIHTTITVAAMAADDLARACQYLADAACDATARV